MRRIIRAFPLIALASLAVPVALGLALSGGALGAALTALLLGRARVNLPRAPHHLKHQLDLPLLRQPPLRDRHHSTNVFWLAHPSLGEAWHHNHHAFPRSAFHREDRLSTDSTHDDLTPYAHDGAF